jgi:hypothetical protein
MIVVGGAMAVIANTLYPLARAQEARERLANDARTILLPETKRNSALVVTMQGALETGGLIPLTLDVTAWEPISKGGLLLGLKPDEITKFLHIYSLANRANQLITQLLEAATGVGSALQSAPQTRQTIISNLQTTLRELQNAFSEVDQKPQFATAGLSELPGHQIGVA